MRALVDRRRGATAVSRLVPFVLLGGLLVALSGCAHHASPQGKAASQAPPAPSAAKRAAVLAALTDVETHADDIYNLARSGKWQQASKAYSSIKQTMQTVEAQAKGQEDKKEKLRAQVTQLGAGIKSKDKHHASLAASELSWQAAQIGMTNGSPAPLAIARLHFDGRQVQVSADAKDSAGLLSATTDILDTWSAMRLEILRHGGTKEAKAFDQAVSRLAKAPTPSACAAAASTLLDRVDDLAAVFKRSGLH